MQERVTTSFIPKEALSTEQPARRAPKGNPFVLVNIIAIGILVVAVVASGAVFAFQAYTVSSIASKQSSLERQRSAFEPATIEELSRLDKRLSSSEKLLKTHTALSLLFGDLETRTNTNVRFRDFTYEQTAPGKMTITMNGSARSFNAVALQSESFAQSTYLSDPIFSNLNIDQNGNVVFTFMANINVDRISYGALIAAAGAAVPTQTNPSQDSGPTVPPTTTP